MKNLLSHPYAQMAQAILIIELIVLLMGVAIFMSCSAPAASVETVECADYRTC